MYSDSQKKNAPYGNALEPGDAGLDIYGYLISRFGLDGINTSRKNDKYYLTISSSGKLISGTQINGAESITWLQTIMNDTFKIIGNIKTFQVRSGNDGIKNIYFDVVDTSGNKNSIAFFTDNENAIKFLKNDTVVWKLNIDS